MKKKLVISIVSIMSFILLLSGILILNNKEVKNSSVDKEIKSENKEDTTWQEDFEYIRDKKNNYVLLGKYKGNAKNVTIHKTAIIDGVEYRVMPQGVNVWSGSVFDETLDSLVIEDGVLFPLHDYFVKRSSAKKIKIGKVDLSLIDFFDRGSALKASEELDLSDFDNTSMERLSIGDYSNAKACFYAPKVILGKKNILLKKWNGIETKISLCGSSSNTVYWLREGTNEVYSSIDLPYQYDGETMSGTYLEYKDAVLNYNPNGGAGYMVSRKLDSTTKADENKFERYGYTFNGWNTESDGSGTSYGVNDTVSSEETITLYAQWIKNDINLETKTLHLTSHINEKDAEYANPKYKVYYKLKLKMNGETYTDDIKIEYDDSVKTITPENGIYTIHYDKEECPSTYTNCEKLYFAKNGINIILPEGIEYELEQFAWTLNSTEFLSESVNGKLNENKNVDAEVRTPKMDINIYLLEIDPFKIEEEHTIYVDTYGGEDIASDKTLHTKIDGSVEEEFDLKSNGERHYFKMSSGDFITIHDVPPTIIWNVHDTNIVQPSDKVYYTLAFCDYSGHLTSNNPSHYTFIFKTNDIGTITIKKNNSIRTSPNASYLDYKGVEYKKFKFKIVAHYGITNRPFDGKYPYVLLDEKDNEKGTGNVIFKDGVAIVELYPGEKIKIGRVVKDYYNRIYEEEGFIPSKNIEYTVEELDVDKNKYILENSQYTHTTTDIIDFHNRRKICNIEFSKNFSIDDSEIDYISIKNKLNESDKESIEYGAINYKLGLLFNNEAYIDFAKEKLGEEKVKEVELKLQSYFLPENVTLEELEKIVETNEVSKEYQDIYENNYKTDDVTALDFYKNMYENYVNNVKQDYLRNLFNSLKTEIMNNKDKLDLYDVYNEFVQKYKNLYYNNIVPKEITFRLKIKDDANLKDNEFSFRNSNDLVYNDEHNLTYTFKAPVNLVINGNKQTDNKYTIGGLWCGMEYEIEELDSDNYEKELINTKGILVHTAESEYNYSINKVSINNKLRHDSLTLKKEIKGNVSKDEEFKFDITLELKEEDRTEYIYSGSKEGIIEFVDGKASITLKGGESITISDLPHGTKYKVEEQSKGYKVKKENDTGTIDKETVVTFTNSKEVKKTSEIVNTLDGVGKYIAVALVSIIGIVTTIFLRKHSLER